MQKEVSNRPPPGVGWHGPVVRRWLGKGTPGPRLLGELREGASFLHAKRTRIQSQSRRLPKSESAQLSSETALPDPEVLGGLGEDAPEPARARPRGTPAGGWALPEARRIAAAANMAETSEEVAVLVQRVVKDITNAFRRNPHM